MIVVDTNIWSESLRPQPDPSVLAWMCQRHRDLHMPAVVRHELRYGVLRLPAGHRRDALAATIEGMLATMDERLLPYDSAAADAHADLRVRAEHAGRVLSTEDGQILATALARGAAVATRNVRDFVGYDLQVIDPWV